MDFNEEPQIDAEECRRVKPILAAFALLPEHLTSEIIEKIGSHLAKCAGCQRELHEILAKEGRLS